MDSETESLRTKYCPELDCKAEAYLSPDVYQLINKLLLHIHESERDTEKGILVFLPTYYALEQQWDVLSGCSIFKVHILHRSIDIDEALETMKASKSCRKVKVVIFQFNLVVQLHVLYLKYLPVLLSYVVLVVRHNAKIRA